MIPHSSSIQSQPHVQAGQPSCPSTCTLLFPYLFMAAWRCAYSCNGWVFPTWHGCCVMCTTGLCCHLQECWAAWRRLCQSQSAVRARVYKLLCRVVLSWRRQRLQQGVRFWRMYTACSICERLQLRLPAFPQPCDAFDAWLWKHQRRQQLVKQAAGLAGRLGVLRCFGEHPDHPAAMTALYCGLEGRLHFCLNTATQKAAHWLSLRSRAGVCCAW